MERSKTPSEIRFQVEIITTDNNSVLEELTKKVLIIATLFYKRFVKIVK